MKYEYKYVMLEIDDATKLSLDMAAAGHEGDSYKTASEKVLGILIQVMNKYGKAGWKLYSWALNPVPHILMEKGKTK